MTDVITKTEAIYHLVNDSGCIARDINNFYNSLPNSAVIISTSIMFPVSYITYKVSSILMEDYLIYPSDGVWVY